MKRLLLSLALIVTVPQGAKSYGGMSEENGVISNQVHNRIDLVKIEVSPLPGSFDQCNILLPGRFLINCDKSGTTKWLESPINIREPIAYYPEEFDNMNPESFITANGTIKIQFWDKANKSPYEQIIFDCYSPYLSTVVDKNTHYKRNNKNFIKVILKISFKESSSIKGAYIKTDITIVPTTPSALRTKKAAI